VEAIGGMFGCDFSDLNLRDVVGTDAWNHDRWWGRVWLTVSVSETCFGSDGFEHTSSHFLSVVSCHKSRRGSVSESAHAFAWTPYGPSSKGEEGGCGGGGGGAKERGIVE
jgi:hypothetical protein